MFSIPHMIVIFLVVLIVFGPQKLPELARGLGKLMAEFRKASGDFKNAFEQEMRDLERQATLAERKKQAEAAAAEPAALPSPGPADPASSAAQPPEGPRLGEEPVITPVAESVPHSSSELDGVASSEPERTRESQAEKEGTPTDTPEEAKSRELPYDLQRPA
jgi:sec-independent protein translocase protein TatB